jgi:hypothetical protein
MYAIARHIDSSCYTLMNPSVGGVVYTHAELV